MYRCYPLRSTADICMDVSTRRSEGQSRPQELANSVVDGGWLFGREPSHVVPLITALSAICKGTSPTGGGQHALEERRHRLDGGVRVIFRGRIQTALRVRLGAYPRPEFASETDARGRTSVFSANMYVHSGAGEVGR